MRIRKFCKVCGKEFTPFGCQKCCSKGCSAVRLKAYDKARSGKPRGPSMRKAYKRDDGLDPDFWKSVDSAGKAYILGYLITDGNLHERCVRWRIKEEDVGVLWKIRDFVGSGDVKNSVENGKTYVGLRVNSAEWERDLLCLGVTYRKSKKAPFIDCGENRRHFIRGCIDGDGGIDMVGVTPVLNFYSASEDLVVGVKGACDEVVGEAGVMGMIHGIHRVRWHVRATKILLCWLYYGATLYIDRKYRLASPYFYLKDTINS